MWKFWFKTVWWRLLFWTYLFILRINNLLIPIYKKPALGDHKSNVLNTILYQTVLFHLSFSISGILYVIPAFSNFFSSCLVLLTPDQRDKLLKQRQDYEIASEKLEDQLLKLKVLHSVKSVFIILMFSD